MFALMGNTFDMRVSEGYIFKCTVDSGPTDTSLLRTPCHYSSPGETRREMNKIYSCCCGFSQLGKCRHFHNSQRAIADTSSKLLAHALLDAKSSPPPFPLEGVCNNRLDLLEALIFTKKLLQKLYNRTKITTALKTHNPYSKITLCSSMQKSYCHIYM